MTIGAVVVLKGGEAAKLMDKLFCNSRQFCCEETSVTLEFAMRTSGNEKQLPSLLQRLSEMEDIAG
jgi:hypothetical protein